MDDHHRRGHGHHKREHHPKHHRRHHDRDRHGASHVSPPPLRDRHVSSYETSPPLHHRHRAGHEASPPLRDRHISSYEAPPLLHYRHRGSHEASPPLRDRHRGGHEAIPLLRDRPRVSLEAPSLLRDWHRGSHKTPPLLHHRHRSETPPHLRDRHSGSHVSPPPLRDRPSGNPETSPPLHHRHRRSQETPPLLHDKRSSSHEESPQLHNPRRDSCEPPPPAPKPSPFKGKNFKLVVDPALVKGKKKLYRFDGVVPFGDASWNVTNIKDPRFTGKWSRLEALDLPVPRFQVDSNYVGDPPGVEVTISNLNDNIDKQFLKDMALKYGEVEDLEIYYHPATHKHLGIARLVFVEVQDAAACVSALNLRSVMGQQLDVFLDPFGRECQKSFEDLTTVKTTQIVVETEDPSPEPPCVGAPKSELGFKEPKEEESSHAENERFQNGQRSQFNNDERKQDIPDAPVGQPPALEHRSELSESMSPEYLNAFKPPMHIPPPPTIASPPFSHYPVPTRIPYPPPHPLMGLRLPNRPQPTPTWNDSANQWGYPVPPPGPQPPIQRFMSPPHLPPPGGSRASDDGPLNLDARIEFLLKGNFLAMNINDAGQSVKPPPPLPVPSDLPPPLPPGDDRPPPPSPTPSTQSAYSPLNSPFADYSADKYDPTSPTPSPFRCDEEYVHSLWNWRLKHLAVVKQRERDSRFVLESEKVFEVISDKDETDYMLMKRRATVDKDRMSFSSQCPTGKKIEVVTVPSNPYGSYKFGQNCVQNVPSSISERNVTNFVPPSGHYPYPWGNYPAPPHGHHPFNMCNPFAPPPTIKPLRPEVSCKMEVDSIAVNIALEQVTNLLQSTLEKDLIKSMTEALAFHELELWWAAEMKKYKAGLIGTEKDKEVNEEKEEKKATSESLLNSVIDPSYEGSYGSLGLGFRASLPKMPSFRRKVNTPLVTVTGEDSQDLSNNKMNESDEEEMVQQSDTEGEDMEPESMMTKKRRAQQEANESSEESTSDSDDSESSSDTEDATNFSTDNHSSAKEEFLASVDSELLEKMREKTPEGRLTPIPVDDFSESDPENLPELPKSPDGQMSDHKKEELPATPSSNDRRQTAMAALSALGLDEFISDIIIRDDCPKVSKPKIKPPSPTLPLSSNQHRRHEHGEKEKRKEVNRIEKENAFAPTPEISKPESKPEGKENYSLEEDSNSVPYNTLQHSYPIPKEPQIVGVPSWELDHDYCAPVRASKEKKDIVQSSAKEKKKSSEKLESHVLNAYLKRQPRGRKVYSPRDTVQEMMACYDFLTTGVDQEDIMYLKRTYDNLLADEGQSYWLSDMHWVNHHATVTPTATSRRQRLHATGCARAEGYYKMTSHEKQKHRHHYNKNKVAPGAIRGIQTVAEPKANVAASREARSNQRRLLTAFGTDNDSDLLKFNQLKFRKKQLKFSKSEIHDWGLFAVEPIAADEMVIEYAGQMVRPFLADFREKGYEKSGIGSSYLFRIDTEAIVDATHCGNLSRFINHSCNPNCHAKIITIEGEKKIVIYSKRDIQVDEEITYDYKFPFEEEKIKCLCGEAQCKGFLN